MLEPIQTPSLVESATILASVAGLVALPVAWRSYRDDERRSRDAVLEGVRNVLAGLGPEMEVVKHWAGGVDGKGYPPHGDDVETYDFYRRSMPGWLNPLRNVMPLVCPAIASLPVSKFAAQVGPLIQPFGLLNLAIASLAKAEDGRAEFVNRSSAMVIRMRRLWNEPNQRPTKEELDFSEVVFFLNYAIHVQVIGSAESESGNTLFRAYDAARAALDEFSKSWEDSIPPRVWWHALADAASWVMLAAAVVIFCSWVWRMADPLPRLLWWLARSAT